MILYRTPKGGSDAMPPRRLWRGRGLCGQPFQHPLRNGARPLFTCGQIHGEIITQLDRKKVRGQGGQSPARRGCQPTSPDAPGRRARSDAPYLTAIQRGRWPVRGSVNPDPGILHPPECIRSALATEAGVKTKRSTCAKKSAGRAGSPLPAAVANPRHLRSRDGAHGVTRPT